MLVDDPHGLVEQVAPDAHLDVAYGDTVAFDITVTGTVVAEPSARTEQITVSLVTEDRILLTRRVLFVEP